MVETVEEHNNESVMDDPCSSESITNEEAFVLYQAFNKTDRPTIGKLAKLAPILFAHVCTGLGKPQPKDAQVLLDLGVSTGSIISYKLVQNLHLKDCTKSMWETAAGTLSTNQKAKVEFKFPNYLETTCFQKYFKIQSNYWKGFVTSPGNPVRIQKSNNNMR